MSTKFENSRFNWDGTFLTYGEDRRFVARFKHMKGNQRGFRSFLIKNFTVEEYFSKLADLAPVQVLEEKGFVLPHIQKWMVRDGFEPTRENYRAWRDSAWSY